MRSYLAQLRQSQQLGEQPNLTLFDVVELNVQRPWCVKTWVAAVEVAAALGVEQTAVGVNRGLRGFGDCVRVLAPNTQEMILRPHEAVHDRRIEVAAGFLEDH